MPELPEVETIAQGVNARVRGDVIREAWFSTVPQTFKTPRPRQAGGLAGKKILSVHRTGKHIVCELGLPQTQDAVTAQWIVHLGMTGRLLVTTPDGEVPPHTHARLQLESGRELRFVDPRRFGRLEFRELNAMSHQKKNQPFTAPGLDPLTIEAAEFRTLFKNRKLAIKAALLNQSLLSGVGNIYADESLFHARIRPTRKAGRLTAAELETLRLALKKILLHAIELGGSSVSDYVDADGVRGFFQLEHCVYLRTGEPCLVCGKPIRRIELAGRGTHYCLQCQH
jgi:formamidopyrimidine-DNA glycosylase